MFLPLLFVAAALQSEMSPQEKKATGLYKLNQKERSALQTWIDNHYAAQAPGPTKEAMLPKSQLEENLHEGRYIRLKDGSTWEIHPKDTPITQAWITPVDISISPSDDAVYNYTLTNTLTKSAVRAKKVSSVPKTPPTPPGRSVVPPTPPPQPARGK